MNAKLCKALRRMVREGMKPGTPQSKLLGKPIRTRSGEDAIQAVNATNSERGKYLKLKEAYETHAEVREQVDGLIGYRKILKYENERLAASMKPVAGSDTEKADYTYKTYPFG